MVFALFFLSLVGEAFLLGVLQKCGAKTWCFDGQFVVRCVAIVVR
jgi:hypothetical protein